MTMTESHRLTIRVALRVSYVQAMTHWERHEQDADFWLSRAQDAWDTYLAFVGYAMSEPRPETRVTQ